MISGIKRAPDKEGHTKLAQTSTKYGSCLRSVQLAVSELQLEPYNSVLAFKMQGSIDYLFT